MSLAFPVNRYLPLGMFVALQPFQDMEHGIDKHQIHQKPWGEAYST